MKEDRRGKRRTEEGGTRERGKRKGRGDVLHAREGEKLEEDRNNNSLVLSLYSDKFPSRPGVSAPAGARPDDKPPPPCTAALAIYDQATCTSRPGSQLGLDSSRAGVVTPGPHDNLKWGHSVTSHLPLLFPPG